MYKAVSGTCHNTEYRDTSSAAQTALRCIKHCTTRHQKQQAYGLRQSITAQTIQCSRDNRRPATLRHSSAAARQSTTAQSTAWQHCAYQQHKTKLRTAAVCDSKGAVSVQMLQHRPKAALHSNKEHRSHFTADHRLCKNQHTAFQQQGHGRCITDIDRPLHWQTPFIATKPAATCVIEVTSGIPAWVQQDSANEATHNDDSSTNPANQMAAAIES